MKIAVLESLAVSDEKLKALEAPLIARGCSFHHYERTAERAELIREAKDADVLMLANMPLPAEVVAAAEGLKYIDVAFTGVDHIPMDLCRARGIAVSNASGYSNEAVPELAVGMVLSILRNLRQVEQACRAGGTKAGLVGTELKGKTVGILGYGSIGSRSGELFHAFGCRIVTAEGHRIKNRPDFLEVLPQAEVLRQADVLVLHTPLNEATRGLIGKAELEMMKPTSILVNVARGPVVVTDDLIEALNRGTIAAAAVDVFDREPPLDPALPLLHAPNTLFTPHVAFATAESMELRAKIVFENLAAYLDGEIRNRMD